MIKVINKTGLFEDAELFTNRKLEKLGIGFDDDSVSIRFKTRKNPYFNGYVRPDNKLIACNVHPFIKFPFICTTESLTITFNNLEEVMVYLAGHEVGHYLNADHFTKRYRSNRRNCEVEADDVGTLWLEEFIEEREAEKKDISEMLDLMDFCKNLNS